MKQTAGGFFFWFQVPFLYKLVTFNEGGTEAHRGLVPRVDCLWKHAGGDNKLPDQIMYCTHRTLSHYCVDKTQEERVTSLAGLQRGMASCWDDYFSLLSIKWIMMVQVCTGCPYYWINIFVQKTDALKQINIHVRLQPSYNNICSAL